MSIIIGLTGPTGSGKSSVQSIAKKFGLKVINCDETARTAVLPGSEGLKAVVTAFGEDILCSDGSLDRRALAAKAFSSRDKTQLLNSVLLPHIKKLVIEQMGSDNVLLDAPTLFESGLDEMCTATVAVLADKSIRRERIIARDGLSEKDADIRLNAGKSDDFYIEKAGSIVYNNVDIDAFNKEINSVLKTIIGGNKIV